MNMIFRNQDVRKLTTRVMVASGILIVVFTMILRTLAMSYAHEISIRDYAQIVNLLEKHENLKVDIINTISKEPTEEELQRGRVLAEKYGVNEKTSIRNISYIDKGLGFFTILNIAFMILTTLIILIITFITLNNIYAHIRGLGMKTQRLIDESYENNLEIKDKEGDFVVLEHSINRMSMTLKNSMELLQEEKENLKNILSDISHQLKTPLTSLITFNELILYGNIKNEEIQKDCLIKSNRQLERMEFLIKNLLKMARLEVNAVGFHKQNYNLVSTIQESIEELRGVFKERINDIALEYNEEDIEFYHDVNWMKEAVINLLKNSLEHSEEKPIKVTIEKNRIFTSVVIRDNGTGIKAEDIPNIFKRFYRGQRANSDSIGIGLFISKSIIEKHNGSITCRSRYGYGTEFEIIFMNSY